MFKKFTILLMTAVFCAALSGYQGGKIMTEEKTQTATVVAIGPGTDEVKITVKEGDRIMYDKYSGTPVKIDGEDHLILKMNDIVAIIE